ncbi:TMV resistance protein N-like [Benincasa hispida]|uniref:TMV resistance protein N-like n=1 Tax=Benincasa hispida TaxID=102211 RepID=UPI0018FF23C9|nr:TMV resistance protein N-like [Benincasa hispida]
MEVQSSTFHNHPRMSYDVFISFRGTDTRNTFIGFLYDALRRLGIMTFMDDKKILMGDNLSKKLMKAIEESRFSIVILSKNYASSKWCLKELTKIIATMGRRTDLILPVFYHVAPSDMNVELGLGLDDVRFIGMVGMGGIGKTTIAKVVYDCIASKFDGSCFLHVLGNDSKKDNLVSLQEQLLSHFGLKENIRIWNENLGAEMIGNRLRNKRVLLVLDGVEKKEQLNMLARGPHWFGPGSRVIITTTNRDLLHQPYKIHEFNVKFLDAHSSLQAV